MRIKDFLIHCLLYIFSLYALIKGVQLRMESKLPLLVSFDPFWYVVLSLEPLLFLVEPLFVLAVVSVMDYLFMDVADSNLSQDLEARQELTQKLCNYWWEQIVETDLCSLMSEASTIYTGLAKPSRDDFEEADQLGFIHHLAEYLGEVLESKANSVLELKHYILNLQMELKLVVSSFMRISKQHREVMDTKDLLASIASLAHEAEFAIDMILVNHIPVWYGMYWLVRITVSISEKSEIIRMESTGDEWQEAEILSQLNIHGQVIPLVLSDYDPREVIFNIIDKGVIQSNFSPLMVCTVTDTLEDNKKSVTVELLKQAPLTISDSEDMLYKASLDKCVQMLYASLVDRRYLVILFDVPDGQVLFDILNSLPGCCGGSKVVVVNPSLELAHHIRHHQYAFELLKTFGPQPSASPCKTVTKKTMVSDDVVGFKIEEEKMLDHLLGGTRGMKQFQVLSIVGMAGQGKTTFASKLYSHPSVADYFHVRAWCFVSQIYQTRGLLLELLGQLGVEVPDRIHKKSEFDLKDMLYKKLSGQRYLIIMDDVWDTRAWDDLRRCFPYNNNGSRVIFTTRIQVLASQAKSGSFVQPLNPLSDEESWELLQKKLFLKQSLHPKLEAVGREIAKNCNGLPLAVVLASGLVAKMNMKEDEWEKIAESLSPQILNDSEAQCRGLLELSYQHLPDHLKPCFLYFGKFPEGRAIPVKKIIRLWISEGFIHNNTQVKSFEGDFQLKKSKQMVQSLEEVAESYMMELIRRSLVLVADERSKGGIKICRVHDLLHSFCLVKAKEEISLHQVNGRNNEDFASIEEKFDDGIDQDRIGFSEVIRYDKRRLGIYCGKNHFISVQPSAMHIRSLFFLTSSDMCPNCPYDVSYIFATFKLLKILDLEDINIGNSFRGIDRLVLLRYLAVQIEMDCVPASITNLSNLETLLIKGVGSEVIKVPDTIWDMRRLRHVVIVKGCTYNFEMCRLQDMCLLSNMQTIGSLNLVYGDGNEQILRRLPSIRKLDCRFSDSWDDVRNCNWFPVLDYLSKLESLKVFYNGEGKYPCEFNLPANLKKLTLSNFQMQWSQIAQFQKLHNLEVLKLMSGAFHGEAWEMEEDEEFQKLRFLKLDSLDLQFWNASEVNFPCLEHLVLHRCEQLDAIPSGIGEIQTLLRIDVMWCSRSAAISACKIQEEQFEYCNEDLKVNVHPRKY